MQDGLGEGAAVLGFCWQSSKVVCGNFVACRFLFPFFFGNCKAQPEIAGCPGLARLLFLSLQNFVSISPDFVRVRVIAAGLLKSRLRFATFSVLQIDNKQKNFAQE
eukprot:c1593_g1_i2.p1 GENE.c1593_g1_i2~~c1593_g1_i2.p1  ORF type:complete len:106 (+),score=8.23 c1593_g1_i2:207-524(+)